MSFRTRVGLILMSLLVGGAALTAPLAASEPGTNISAVTVIGGVLSALIRQPDPTAFSPAPFSSYQQESPGSLALTVTDERGRRTGWNVTLAGVEFTAGRSSLPIANLALGAGDIEVQIGNHDLSTQATTDLLPVLLDQQTLWIAAPGGGDGEYLLWLAGSLQLPGGAHPARYRTILTVALTGNTP